MRQAINRTSKARRSKPRIILGNDRSRIIDQAISALTHEHALYERGGQLCTIVRDLGRGATLQIGTSNTNPRIVIVKEGRLAEMLGDNAEWCKRAEEQLRRCVPPAWVARSVLDRQEWPGIRRLRGIIECPTMRPDGTIIDSDGYDEGTGVYAENLCGFPRVDPNPDKAAVKRATAMLLGLVSQFPFMGEEHRAAWLAAVLTPLARFAITGACPMILFDASTPGSGKTMLADLVAITATAREAARTPYFDHDEEMGKVITAIVLEGRRIVLLDNIATRLGGSQIEAAMTGLTWNGRILGASRTAGEAPLNAVWLATGNNVQIKDDMERRIVPCRLGRVDNR